MSPLSKGGGGYHTKVKLQSRAEQRLKVPPLSRPVLTTRFCTQWTIGPLWLDSLSSDLADSSELHLPQDRNATRYSAEN